MKPERINLLQSICLAYMVAWGISPPLQVGNIFRIIMLASFLLWNVIAISKCGRRLIDFEVKILLLLSVMIGVAWFFDGMSLGFISNLQLIIFFCYFCVFYYYYITDKAPLGLFVFILLLIAVWNVTTLVGYGTVRNISRLLSKEFEGMENYMRRGIGGYGYIYSVAIALPIFAGLTFRHLQEFKISYRLLIIFDMVTSAVMIFMSGYMIAFIISLSGIVITLMFKKKKSSIVIVSVIAILSVLLALNAERILLAVLPYAKGSMYEEKIYDMIVSLSTDEAVGTVGGRTERYMRSIALFFRSPLFGQLSRASVGKHSAILDRFAQYGVIVGGFFLYYVTYAQRLMIKRSNDVGIAVAVLAASLIQFLFNNITYSLGVTLYVLFPIAVNLMNKKRIVSEEEEQTDGQADEQTDEETEVQPDA